MCCNGSLPAAITAVALALAEGKSTAETSLLGAIFTQLGDTLATIAAQQELCPKKAEF